MLRVAEAAAIKAARKQVSARGNHGRQEAKKPAATRTKLSSLASARLDRGLGEPGNGRLVNARQKHIFAVCFSIC